MNLCDCPGPRLIKVAGIDNIVCARCGLRFQQDPIVGIEGPPSPSGCRDGPGPCPVMKDGKIVEGWLWEPVFDDYGNFLPDRVSLSAQTKTRKIIFDLIAGEIILKGDWTVEANV